jgi:hypothetical protein
MFPIFAWERGRGQRRVREREREKEQGIKKPLKSQVAS